MSDLPFGSSFKDRKLGTHCFRDSVAHDVVEVDPRIPVKNGVSESLFRVSLADSNKWTDKRAQLVDELL